ncbi:MAG: helix-hairpin-helix domain-containing protein [Oligoflexia bacterium]|nr:helix-hairpin-helix domain-containing protein [Oligoflexia bacterium]
MDRNSEAIALLEDMRRLLELSGENPFKVRAFARAAEALEGLEDLEVRARAGTLEEIPGIGKGIAEVLREFLLQGSARARDALLSALPAGLAELTELPGVGPKKARELIEELGISSVGELEYACRENRLLKLKGFGPKLQQKILEGIAFRNSARGFQRLGDVFDQAERAFERLRAQVGGARVSETGALRRRMEVLSALEFLVELPEGGAAAARARAGVDRFLAEEPCALPVKIHFAEARDFGFSLARTTASEGHWSALGAPAPFETAGEEEFYAKLGLPWIPPEMRETGEEVALARSGGLAAVLGWNGLQGLFHCHTERSDGATSLEALVLEARRLGYRYLGVSDHSRSAFYANGLTPESLAEQEKEVRRLREKYPDFTLFWGIESDILADGSLDYEPSVLSRFDFVIASIHSRFGMDRQAMTERVLAAIRDPHTRFVGHLTGRLLLDRPGYELDMERVLLEAAERGVAIELNSHPARLDIDWRWGGELRRNGLRVSINPDAHEPAGLADVRYGVAMARKALLSTESIVNARPAAEVSRWLKRS